MFSKYHGSFLKTTRIMEAIFKKYILFLEFPFKMMEQMWSAASHASTRACEAAEKPEGYLSYKGVP